MENTGNRCDDNSSTDVSNTALAEIAVITRASPRGHQARVDVYLSFAE